MISKVMLRIKIFHATAAYQSWDKVLSHQSHSHIMNTKQSGRLLSQISIIILITIWISHTLVYLRDAFRGRIFQFKC